MRVGGERMGLAKEGIREMLIATVVLAGAAWALSQLHWAATLPAIVVWVWVISFFRDPRREGVFQAGELCAPADGTVTEVTHLDYHDAIGGPATRIGIFLSIFNVHANRAPCAGTVREVTYRPGRFLDARHPDSGSSNESNTLVMDVEAPYDGPVVVRQISGLLARRIICHARVGTTLSRGQRFGMIKFGSRTELIVPESSRADIAVKVGDKVKAGLTVLLRQAPVMAMTRQG
jgi:phosphatidylserine decarboxylase